MNPNEDAGVTDADLARWRVGFEAGWVYGPVILGRLAMANTCAISALRMVGVPSLAGPPQIGAFAGTFGPSGRTPIDFGQPEVTGVYMTEEQAETLARVARGAS